MFFGGPTTIFPPTVVAERLTTSLRVLKAHVLGGEPGQLAKTQPCGRQYPHRVSVTKSGMARWPGLRRVVMHRRCFEKPLSPMEFMMRATFL